MLGTWGIEGLVDMIVGTGGAEIYDYTLDISKAQYPLDGELIKEIVKHYEDMDCNFAIPEDGIFIHQRMMNIFKIFLKGIEFLIRLLIMMNI